MNPSQATPKVTSTILQKYNTDIDFAKLVISLAIDETIEFKQLKDVSNPDAYRMAKWLRDPFLKKEAAEIDLMRTLMPPIPVIHDSFHEQIYAEATSNADLARRLIQYEMKKPIKRLQDRLQDAQKLSSIASVSYIVLAILTLKAAVEKKNN